MTTRPMGVTHCPCGLEYMCAVCRVCPRGHDDGDVCRCPEPSQDEPLAALPSEAELDDSADVFGGSYHWETA